MGLFTDLKNRKVVQWTLTYLAGAFAVLQVLDVVAGQFGWPAAVQRGITLLLVVGAFVVPVLAWYHGERGAQKVTGIELLILSVLLIVGGVVAIQIAPDTPQQLSSETRPDSVGGLSPIRSIAVLPLDNYSGDAEQEYFAEGMTDELTAELATISSLRVISRGSTTQFKGASRAPTPEIRRILNVDAIVEGSVRRVGDRVRITAQLIDAREDRHLWANTFDRHSIDVLALQGELASAIAREINVQLSPDEAARLASRPAIRPEAYDAYLKGRFFLNRPSDDNISRGIQQFERAIELDPAFAPAYSGLSDLYLWAGFNETVLTSAEGGSKAEEMARTAARLAPDSAEAITSLAIYVMFYDFDWRQAEDLFRKAIALNDSYAFAHDQFSLLLSYTGRFDEAIAESRRAAALDPLSPQVLLDLVVPLTWSGRTDEALEQIEQAANLDPTYAMVPWMKGWIQLQRGDLAGAIAQFERAVAMNGASYCVAWLAYAYGTQGERYSVERGLAELERRSIGGKIPAFFLALAHLGQGELEKALDYLERAREERSQWLAWLKNDRVLDPLRDNPRFERLLQQVRLDSP